MGLVRRRECREVAGSLMDDRTCEHRPPTWHWRCSATGDLRRSAARKRSSADPVGSACHKQARRGALRKRLPTYAPLPTFAGSHGASAAFGSSEGNRVGGLGPTMQIVASESSRLGARDERFAADAGRVDRIRGDRFGDGANRSRASQLTRDTPRSARTNHADGRAPTLDPGPRGRPARRGAILRRMPLASSGSVCASPG